VEEPGVDHRTTEVVQSKRLTSPSETEPAAFISRPAHAALVALHHEIDLNR
jgi:hypothetical protein